MLCSGNQKGKTGNRQELINAIELLGCIYFEHKTAENWGSITQWVLEG